jgi:hypothetical protein
MKYDLKSTESEEIVHRVSYEEVGRFPPWWKMAIGWPAEYFGWWRIRDWCLTYRVN